MTDRLAALTAQGVSLWLDDLSRQRLQSGNLKDLIDTWHIGGVTTNPSIFQAALKDGASYQKQLDELAARGATVDDTVREVTTDDVRDACDLFTGIFQATGPRRRPGVHRGRPPAGPRHRRPPSSRPRSCTRSSTGPTC